MKIWYDSLSNSTVAAKDSKSVAVRSTGHSKIGPLSSFLHMGMGLNSNLKYYFPKNDLHQMSLYYMVVM